MRKSTILSPSKCPTCGAWTDATVRLNGRGYCARCGTDVDAPSRPGIDWAAQRRVERVAEHVKLEALRLPGDTPPPPLWQGVTQ
jgi:hypothetical protein